MSSDQPRKLSRPALFIFGTVVLVNLFIAALAGAMLRASYQQYLERAAIVTRNTNRLVSQSIAAESDRIDMALRAARDEYRRQSAAGRIDRHLMTAFLRRQQEQLPMADSIRIADAGGLVVVGTDKELPSGVTIADRDYFLALRDGGANRLVVSKPVLGRISGKWVLIFARGLERADGRFDGVVYGAVTIDWFNRKFARLEVGDKGTVVLRGDATRNFDLLARFPQAGFVGQTTVSPQFTAMITANPQGGTYEAHAGADNIRRVFSYSQVEGYPFITLVGFSTDDTLAPWWQEVYKLVAATAIFALLSAIGGWVVLRAWNARTQAYREVRELNALLEQDNIARRAAEAEVVRLNSELERKVVERTAQLEAANKELEAYSYSISHDLRAPLRVIDGFSHILVDDYADRLDGDAKRSLEAIRRNAVRMGYLIDDILEFSRMSRAKMRHTTIDMTALAQEVFDDVRAAAAAERNIVLKLGDLPPAEGERSMIRQVWANLLTNAVKFTACRAEALIEVGASAGEAETTYWVRDNGAGFDMQYASKLFGVFERLHSPQQFEGTGIGLAIVKRVVERHRGRVWAEAKVDAGATMYFTLPVG